MQQEDEIERALSSSSDEEWDETLETERATVVFSCCCIINIIEIAIRIIFETIEMHLELLLLCRVYYFSHEAIIFHMKPFVLIVAFFCAEGESQERCSCKLNHFLFNPKIKIELHSSINVRRRSIDGVDTIVYQCSSKMEISTKKRKS